MGVYSEYLDRKMDFETLSAERKTQLRRISELRGGRDVLAFAADLNKPTAPIAIVQADLLPIQDQLQNLNGKAIDLILETPGGSGEVAEDIVRAVRAKYEDVAVIVPGWAKSAGTIIAMSADEILMGPHSSLGPIDAQLFWQGKVFSAGALIEGMKKIKEEVSKTGVLNKAFIPILQGISPGELQSAENALTFSKSLVRDWLVKYKFRHWTQHASTQAVVTDQERIDRADEIAAALCDHQRWLTHGRSIKIDDLMSMKLRVTDYSASADLADAITRYYTLLQMMLATNIYKVFETAHSQILRFISAPVPAPAAAPVQANIAFLDVPCLRCTTKTKVQANLGQAHPLQAGAVPFPTDNVLTCPTCGSRIDLSEARRQLEAQAKKRVVA